MSTHPGRTFQGPIFTMHSEKVKSYMPWSEQASLLQRKAQQDGLLVEHLVSDTDIAPELFGFDVQQACEKAMKAVLAAHSIAYRRTHNLEELINLIGDARVSFPDSLSEPVAWSPFAVTYRY